MAFEGNTRRVAWLLLGLWLGVTGGLAASGLLTPDPSRPPPNLVLALGGVLALSIPALLAPGRRLIQRARPARIVGFQAFRIPVEIFLWLAVGAGIAPALMSVSGRNFDVVSGVLAAVLGMVMARRAVPRWVVLAFHVIGLGLVLNVVVHAIVATPGPLQRIHGEEPLFVTAFPYVWLPALLVPMAIAGHVLGFRQVLTKPHAV
jgi:hypothetical protein